ncbi:MAG: hypothetical protein OQL08_01080 [Gammaproteobacteria bacterium]|nr:hypothetical protein [Gammaproteobacteria bacterium]
MIRPTIRHHIRLPALVTGALFMALQGCGQQNVKPEEKQSLNNEDYYEAVHDGRIYVFDDAETFRSFLSVGETAYRKVRIGSGPNGETVVFGLTGADKKKSSGIASIEMFDGQLAGAAPFYGEMHVEGRIYVFDRWEDMTAFKQVGEAPLRFTLIGAGPRGETVVFVLNSGNKKQKPEAMIAAFKTMHGMN